MTIYLEISALDALRASQMAAAEHHIAAFTPLGPACDRCRRVLNVQAWAAPCPGLDPVPTQPLSVGPA